MVRRGYTACAIPFLSFSINRGSGVGAFRNQHHEKEVIPIEPMIVIAVAMLCIAFAGLVLKIVEMSAK